MHADRIREESDRELTAATQRRDSINAQLTNVRQMLATLTSAAPVALLGEVADGTISAEDQVEDQVEDEVEDEQQAETAEAGTTEDAEISEEGEEDDGESRG
jgi:hypothetical protein